MFKPCGYYTANGYRGLFPDGAWRFFPTEEEYLDCFYASRAA